MTVIRVTFPLVQGVCNTVEMEVGWYSYQNRCIVLISSFFFLCSVFKVTSIVSSMLFLNQAHFVLKLAIATLG